MPLRIDWDFEYACRRPQKMSCKNLWVRTQIPSRANYKAIRSRPVRPAQREYLQACINLSWLEPHIFVEEFDAALHGGVEMVRDIVVIVFVLVEFHVFIDVEHLIKEGLRKFQWYLFVSGSMM